VRRHWRVARRAGRSLVGLVDQRSAWSTKAETGRPTERRSVAVSASLVLILLLQSVAQYDVARRFFGSSILEP